MYFGLGTLATIPFGLRSVLQWFLSEYKKKSHVTVAFWTLSIAGNVLMLAHYLVQVQFHLYFIRFFPFYFAFRQYALMKGRAKPFSWKRLIKSLTVITFSFTILFMIRVYAEYGNLRWISNPLMPWSKSIRDVSSLWHVLGFIGATLFMSRLWLQWWQSEKASQSILPSSFWWISLIGASLTLSYALYIQDLVTALGYSLGLIPYVRNLMLIKRESKAREAL
ncbi:MAG: hypothetical protein S4CHLAM6_11770 [Chlamydiae bacterium]|nr:hypothetical protein [Chlamydiota bacterium]